MFLFCLVLAMFCARLFICALWSPAGKGLTSWLSFVVSSVSLSLSHWYPGSGVVLDCIDSWSLQPYYFKCSRAIKMTFNRFTTIVLVHKSSSQKEVRKNNRKRWIKHAIVYFVCLCQFIFVSGSNFTFWFILHYYAFLGKFVSINKNSKW